MKLLRAFLVLSLVAAIAGAAAADVVVMKDGRSLEGKIIRETQDSVTLKLKYGEMEIPRSRIAQIRRMATPLEEYEKKAAGVEETAQAHYELGLWCKEKELREEAKKHFRKTLEIDPAFSPAGKALGYEQVEGKWLSPVEAKKARGFVRFEGEWITKEERAHLLAERDEKKQAELRGEYGVGPEFTVAKRKNFVLVSDLSEEERKELLEAAGALYAAMQERFKQFIIRKHKWPLVIFAFSKREDYKERAKQDGLDEAVDSFGYYSGKNQKAYTFRCSAPSTVAMLLHEFTHQVYVERMMKRGVRSHAWIFEGLAEYFEGHTVEDGKLSAPKPHLVNLAHAKQAAKEGTLYPVEKMIEADSLSELFGKEYSSDGCYKAYGQAWAMMYYLLEGDGGRHRAKFLRFMKKDVKGEGTPEEFKRIFGSNLKRFQERLEKFLKGLN